MSRAVYTGGFGNGPENAGRVAEGLLKYYDDVDPFTFSYAMDNPDVIRRAVEGVDAYTHSGGMVALKDMHPVSMTSIGAPLPTWWPKLILKTGYKTLRMHTPGIGIRSREDIAAVRAYDASSATELRRHFRANVGRLGEISLFNAVDASIAATDAGIGVTLGYNHGDEYFQLSAEEEVRASHGGVAVVRMPGIHDELVIRPTQTLAAILGIPNPDWSTVESQ